MPGFLKIMARDEEKRFWIVLFTVDHRPSIILIIVF